MDRQHAKLAVIARQRRRYGFRRFEPRVPQQRSVSEHHIVISYGPFIEVSKHQSTDR
jgi:hypothetical protein